MTRAIIISLALAATACAAPISSVTWSGSERDYHLYFYDDTYNPVWSPWMVGTLSVPLVEAYTTRGCPSLPAIELGPYGGNGALPGIAFCGVSLSDLPTHTPPGFPFDHYLSSEIVDLLTSADEVWTTYTFEHPPVPHVPERLTLQPVVRWDSSGDLNLDGSVDAADAGLLFANWGNTSGVFLSGYPVDAADAAVLFQNWSGDSAPVSVPEPLSRLPLILCLHSMRRCWRRSNSR